MLRYLIFLGLALGFVFALAGAAVAVSWDNDPPAERSGDPDYAAGVQAVKRKDWRRAISSLSKAIKRRPWHDDAHNLLGFSFRKLGDYQRALVHYHKALELNPYHRGAMEYLGETYLELGCPSRAREMLVRLASACVRATGVPLQGREPTCEEWAALKRAIDTFRPSPGQQCLPNG